MTNTITCLVRTAVTSRFGNFISLEMPADKRNTEEAIQLLRSWSYDNWLYYDRKAASEFVAGNIKHAVMLWCKAFMELERADLHDPRLHATLDNLVEAHLALLDLEGAEEFAERNLSLNRSLYGDINLSVMNCHSKLGEIYYRRQRYSDARRQIEESERIAKKLKSGQTQIDLKGMIPFKPPVSNPTSM